MPLEAMAGTPNCGEVRGRPDCVAQDGDEDLEQSPSARPYQLACVEGGSLARARRGESSNSSIKGSSSRIARRWART